MYKSLYTAIVDGRVVATWNHVGMAKRDAEFYLQYCNGFSAWILKGNQLYANKRYDDEQWLRMNGHDEQLVGYRNSYWNEKEERLKRLESR